MPRAASAATSPREPASPARLPSPPTSGCAPSPLSPGCRNCLRQFVTSRNASTNWITMPNDRPQQNERRPVAYLNPEFLNSPDARAMRILAEFLEPLAKFRRDKVRDTIVFFGSARIREDGPMARYYEEARELAR